MPEMKFVWRDYTPADALLIDAWLTPEICALTGLDQGWNAYWNAVLADAVNYPGCIDCCKMICISGTPIAVILYGCYLGTAVISEMIVSPHFRGKGYGAEIIRALLKSYPVLLARDVKKFTAVIFPDNLPSKRAFAKAGFSAEHISEGAETWAYYLTGDPCD